MSRPLDLITVGRCAVDLYCDQIGVPLAEAKSLSMYLGGCSTNVAVGAARLGLATALLTHVGVEETGDFVVATLRREGVDVSHVTRDPDARTPLNIASIQPPDRFHVTYYRERPGDLRVVPEDVSPDWLASATAVLVTGNSLVNEASHRAILAIARMAKSVGTKVVFDIDFRPPLWSGTEAENRAVLQSLLPYTDLLVGTEEEYQAIAGGYEATRALFDGLALQKLGKDGAMIARPGEAPVVVPGFPVTVLNTLGAGDAFLSGFLAAWLRGADLAESLRRGNANGAIVVTRHGCASAMPTGSEVESFLAARRAGT